MLDEPLTLEETLGLSFIAGFEDESGARFHARGNAAARQYLYRILDKQELSNYHGNAWQTLAYLANESDVKRLERSIEVLKKTPRVLTKAEVRTLYALFDALGVMCRRDVKGAVPLAHRMQDRAFWSEAKLEWTAKPGWEKYPVEYQSIYRFMMAGYGLSLRHDMAERVGAIVESAESPEDRSLLGKTFSADFAEMLQRIRKNRLFSEKKAITPAERQSLRQCFNGDLQNPGPSGRVVLAEQEARQRSEQLHERVRSRQAAARAAITDPRARRLLDLAQDVSFDTDDEGRLTGEVRVHLEGQKITDDVLALVDALPGLNSLQMNKVAVTDEGLSHLKKLKRLELVLISSSEGVTDKGLRHLEGATALKSLHLAGLPKVTDVGLRHLAAIKSLERITLTELTITFEGLLSTVANLSNLRQLYVSFGSPPGSEQPAEEPQRQPEPAKPPTAGVRTAKADPRARQLVDLAERVSYGPAGEIERLTLRGEKTTDETLELLDGVPDLIGLSLVKPAVTDEGLKNLAKLKKLQRLTISRSPNVSDEGLRHVASLTTLTAVDLLYLPKVTNAGLEHLKPLKSLEGISLTELGITFDALKSLGGLKKLKRLDVRLAPTPAKAGP